MIREFRIPDIGEGIAEVEIIEWLIGIGDEIQPDQVVATIQTDKSVVEMPTPLAGTVIFLGGKPGDFLPVGSILISIENGIGESSGIPKSADGSRSMVSASNSTILPSAPAFDSGVINLAPDQPSTRVKAAPSVRKLAAERGVDLATIRATGSGGRVTRDDVLGARLEETKAPYSVSGTTSTRQLAESAEGVGEDERVPLRGLRRQIAKKMVESWRSVPHIIDYREVDSSKLIESRQVLREAWPEYTSVLTYLPLFVKVTATALSRHPLLNASFNEEANEYILHRHINIGIATATSDGLLVPVVRGADHKSILELAVEIGKLIELARTRKASLEQLSGGTYTVNNLGSLGTSMGTPIIRIPEVGIAGFGKITERVVARDGVPVVRPILMLSSVGDHRIHDGDTLGAFTSTLVRLLENPYELLAELA